MKTLVTVTDRRIIPARTNAILEQAEIRQETPLNRVRYVRAAATQDRMARLAIDLITRGVEHAVAFHADIANTQVDSPAAAIAESMAIPNVERDELQRQPYASIEAGGKS